MGYFIIILAACLLIFVAQNKKECDPHLKRLEHSNGRISKIEFEGHTYIIWGVNMGGGIVHDPDCQCGRK